MDPAAELLRTPLAVLLLHMLLALALLHKLLVLVLLHTLPMLVLPRMLPLLRMLPLAPWWGTAPNCAVPLPLMLSLLPSPPPGCAQESPSSCCT